MSYLQQAADWTRVRADTDFLAVTNFSSCQATLRRLDKAFQAFFRRCKAGEKPGYPRFKGRNRFDTVEFPSYGDGCKLDGNRVLRLSCIGRLRARSRLCPSSVKPTTDVFYAAWIDVIQCLTHLGRIDELYRFFDSARVGVDEAAARLHFTIVRNSCPDNKHLADYWRRHFRAF